MNRFRKAWAPKTKPDAVPETQVDDGKVSHSTSNDASAPNIAAEEAHLREVDEMHRNDPNFPGLSSWRM
jgi:hypothetical protein